MEKSRLMENFGDRVMMIFFFLKLSLVILFLLSAERQQHIRQADKLFDEATELVSICLTSKL